MSTQSDPRKAEVISDEARPGSSRKRSRKRPFIIEWRWLRWNNNGTKSDKWDTWRKWSAYETAGQRDMALEQKKRSESALKLFQYRGRDL